MLVRDVLVERANANDNDIKYDEVSEKSLALIKGALQAENLSSEDMTASMIKITVKSGYDAFCAIYKVLQNKA